MTTKAHGKLVNIHKHVPFITSALVRKPVGAISVQQGDSPMLSALSALSCLTRPGQGALLRPVPPPTPGGLLSTDIALWKVVLCPGPPHTPSLSE